MGIDIKWKTIVSVLVLGTSIFLGTQLSVQFASTDGPAQGSSPSLEDIAYLSPGEVSSLIQTQTSVNRRSGKAPLVHDDASHGKLTFNLTSMLEKPKNNGSLVSDISSKGGKNNGSLVSDISSKVEEKVEENRGKNNGNGDDSDMATLLRALAGPYPEKGYSKTVVKKIYSILSDHLFIANSMRLMIDAPFQEEVERDTGKKDIDGKINQLLQRDPILMGKYNDIMMPVVMDCRWLAIIGNVVIIAIICFLSSAKSSYLVKDKEGEIKAQNLEKAMRRDITMEELKSHSLPGDIWVAVDGMVCDVSEFTTNHPGGADVLLQHAGSDVSEQFAEVGHSSFANELIKVRMVGVLIGGGETEKGEEEEEKEPSAFVLCARKTFPPQFLSLFTKEDPFQLHKCLGVTVLAHYIIRFVLVVQGIWLLYSFPPGSTDPMMFTGDWFSLASGWTCVLLQISSFQFILPRNRVVGRPMLWQEWRAHNLIFVLRSLAGFTVAWYKVRYAPTTQSEDALLAMVLFACVYAQLYFTDVASRNLRDSKHESLTASWPLWEGCPAAVERFFKFYYSIGINQLTYLVLQTASSGLPTMYANFAGILVLQSDSFMMTLVRKNIISTASFHAFYLWNMWHMAFLVIASQGYVFAYFMGHKIFLCGFMAPMWCVPVAVYLCRYYGLSKYGCWTGFMGKLTLEILCPQLGLGWPWLACPIIWALWAIGQFTFYGYIFELRVRRFLESGRPKALVLKSRDRVTRSLYSLKFQMPPGYHCGFMPGQHLRVLAPNISKGMKMWNGRDNLEQDAEELSRSYTPISAPSSDTFEIMVRYYAKDAKAGFPHGGRASTYLVEELKVGHEILASGPHGQRIYFGNGLFEVIVGQPKMRPRICAFLAGGSGITPAISVMREVQAEARRKANHVEANRLQDYENEVGIEVFEVMHLNRTVEDALPLDFYKDPSQEKQLIEINVHNIVTGTADQRLLTNSFEERCDGQCKWSVQESKLTKAVLAESFPEPAEDVLIIVCGPHSFLNDCKPLLHELGYKYIIPMW